MESREYISPHLVESNLSENSHRASSRASTIREITNLLRGHDNLQRHKSKNAALGSATPLPRCGTYQKP
jgi:hypothetical protein